MRKPTIRVTQLEAFRRFINNTENDRYEITEKSVIDTISGEFKGNEYTFIGSAFHGIIETGEPKFVDHTDGCKIDVYGNVVMFDENQVRIALDYRNEYSGAFHEVRKYKDYGRAIVTGCADLIDGIEIRDIKTKYSFPNDADFINSCQWRYYLDIFSADVFNFDLFVFDGYKKDKNLCDVRGLELKRHTPAITCYRYHDMELDNISLLNEFMDFAESRDLVKYLFFEDGKHTKNKEAY